MTNSDVSVSSALSSALSKAGVSEPSSNELAFLAALESGGDFHLHANHDDSKIALYGAWLSTVEGSSLVITSSDECVSKISQILKKAGCNVNVANDEGTLESGVADTSGVWIATAKIAAVVLKKNSSAIKFSRCVVDSVDMIASSGGPADIEVSLAALKEANADAHTLFVAVEPSLNLAALSRRFQSNPKTFSLRVETASDVEHWYLDIGNALLAKPQALCDLIEAEAAGSVLVFCNSPSDADFADVILKKRGITSQKLIGYVPQLKLSKALQSVQKGETRVLVLTDVAARGVPLEAFNVVVNYGIPSDPEVYFHRYAPGASSMTKKVLSLVSPLDMANFHYLKKLGKLEFQKGELPTSEQLFASKFEGIKKQAVETNALQDESISALVDAVSKDKNSKEIIGLLLHNTLVVMPALKTASASADDSDRSDAGDDYEDDDQDDYNNRRQGQSGRRGGRDGGGRQQHSDRRGGGRRHHDSGYDNDGGGDGDQQDDNRYSEGRGGRGGGRRHQRGDNGEDSPPRQQRKPMPVDRDARLYVGQGKKHGLTADKLISDIISTCQLPTEKVKRAYIREAYSFVDVPEEVGDEVVNQLSEADFDKGEKYYVKRAVTISIPRPGAAVEEEAVNNDGGSSDYESDSIDDGADDSNPTMLSVDEQ